MNISWSEKQTYDKQIDKTAVHSVWVTLQLFTVSYIIFMAWLKISRLFHEQR